MYIKKTILFILPYLIFVSCASFTQSPGTDRDIPSINEAGSLRNRFIEDGWNMVLIDTAREAGYLEISEKDLVMATNAVRSDPDKFASLYVRELAGFYKGSYLEYPGEITIVTTEGIQPVNQLIGILGRQKTLGVLMPSEGLSRAASTHAADQAQTGEIGHMGSDGSDPFERMELYGDITGYAGENISYGSDDGLRILLQLLVDDGVPSRGHRKNILSDNFSQIGVGIDLHPEYGSLCVVGYADGFEETSNSKR